VAILLAAGASRRLGQPKQLLPWKGSSLIRHSLQQLTTELPIPVLVATGTHHAAIIQELEGVAIPLTFCPVDHWQLGQGHTLKFALSLAAQQFSTASHFMIALCDQPWIPSRHFRSLADLSQQEPQAVIATRYPDEKIGVPCIFPRIFLPQLQSLGDEEGARIFLNRPDQRVLSIPCPEAARDIDFPHDILLPQQNLD